MTAESKALIGMIIVIGTLIYTAKIKIKEMI